MSYLGDEFRQRIWISGERSDSLSENGGGHGVGHNDVTRTSVANQDRLDLLQVLSHIFVRLRRWYAIKLGP